MKSLQPLPEKIVPSEDRLSRWTSWGFSDMIFEFALSYISQGNTVFGHMFMALFIGSLVFLLSAILIISQTSLPVINKVFNKKMAESEDAEFSWLCRCA